MLPWWMGLILLTAGGVDSFTLEPRLAIAKRGSHGSYFGLAVTGHPFTSNRRPIQNVVLVGAPLDQGGGALWSCPYTNLDRDCHQVLIGKRGNQSDSMEEEWFGATVHSQSSGESVIVCGHRYVEKSRIHRWGRGRCMTLKQNLEYSATWDPCERRSKARAHEEWGYCQAGISAYLTKDNFALIGSPGPFTWRGTVFSMSIANDFLFRDKTQFHTPVQGQGITLDKYSYMGMSITSGNFLPRSLNCGQDETYASGAPRATIGGKVILFSKCEGHIMPIHRQLIGDGFASSFGYSLASADLNADGLDDLLVGAPFYSNRQGSGGAVYMYKNSPMGLVKDSKRMKLVMPKVEARFGFSVANVGDLNNDQITDVVIGAPYDGRGKIYVFLGSESFFLHTESSPVSLADQIISAEELPLIGTNPPVVVGSFGYSLFGGMDFDNNNHSDIVVGAYESDAIYIVRSRPVIDIRTWFGEHPRVLEPSLMTCSESQEGSSDNARCFTIEACFEIKQFPKNVESAHLAFQVEAEIFTGGRKISRIHFSNPNPDDYPSHVSRKILEIRRSSLSGCFKEMAFLKEDTSDLNIPLKFKLSLWLQQDEPMLLKQRLPQNIDHYPVLNSKQTDKILTIPFLKHCGDDNICQSDLELALRLENREELFTDDVLSVSPMKELVLALDVSNRGEPAYETKIDFVVDEAFTFIGRADPHNDIQCSYREDQSSVHCEVGGPLKQDNVTLLFRVGAHSLKDTLHLAIFNATISTSSLNMAAQDTPGTRWAALNLKTVKRSELSLQASAQPQTFWYGGAIRGESAIKTTNDIGAKMMHTFHINNAGPWPVSSLELVVHWPIQLIPTFPEKPGKWLLYLTEEPELIPRGAGSCFYNSKSVNALGLPPSSRLQRRHVAVPTLECHSNSDELIHCMEIRCQLQQLMPNSDVIVKMRSRVWNSTLVDDFPTLDHIRLRVQGTLVLPKEVKAHQSSDNDQVTVDILGYPSHPLQSTLGSIPTWILVCAVLAGCVVVCIIGLILHQFGFFKRKRLSNERGGQRGGGCGIDESVNGRNAHSSYINGQGGHGGHGGHGGQGGGSGRNYKKSSHPPALSLPLL
ncbi:hypothetical protein TCAL_06649 [Tigriopus californicus]|uniref:Uncharacterized protein n=1 Tax=Tigriopus californicus TaxID=6832 RepID=A0A553NY07_TIGCA|nr:integrin alpha-PS1-like [Tigriopus californicus]TRY70313.1 hypothetical protein TCAL_06649 [Tigriopus californicus]